MQGVECGGSTALRRWAGPQLEELRQMAEATGDRLIANLWAKKEGEDLVNGFEQLEKSEKKKHLAH